MTVTIRSYSVGWRLSRRPTALFLLILTLTGLLGVTASFTHSVSSAGTPRGIVHGPFGVAWNTTSILIDDSYGNKLAPAAVQSKDGVLWLAYASDAPRYVGAPPSDDIWYNTMDTFGNWNLPVCVTCKTTSGQEGSPALAQLLNGTILLFWSSNITNSFYHVVYSRYSSILPGTHWSSPIPLTSAPYSDGQASVTVGMNGTLWLVWSRMLGVNNQLYFRFLPIGGSWTPEVQLTSGSLSSWQGSVLAGRDGKVRVAYSYGLPGANFTIWYDTLNRNSLGPTPVQLTYPSSGTISDTRSSMLQDRNGTLWLFWQRKQPTSCPTTCANVTIYGKASANLGASWTTSETKLTFDDGALGAVDQEPGGIQSTFDKSLWTFYSSNLNGQFDIYAVHSYPVTPVHDVVVTNPYVSTPSGYFSLNPLTLYAGGFSNPYALCPSHTTVCPILQSPLVYVNVQVSNRGDFDENVNLQFTATNTTIITFPSQNIFIPAGSGGIGSFTWNTNRAPPGRYMLSFAASIPIVTAGNALDGSLSIANQVRLLPLGDVDQSGSVTITDISVVFYNYGFSCYTPSTCSPRYSYNFYADINGNGIIDIIDVGVVAKNYGLTG